MSYSPGSNPFADKGGYQPPNPYAPPPGNPYGGPGAPLPPGTVKNYMVESILLFFCCAGILAVPAIVYAAQVDGKLSRGDYQGAVESAENAKRWCLVGLCVGIGCNCLGLMFGILSAAAGG
jgi:hypothetical protein